MSLYCGSVMYKNMECCTMVPKWLFLQLNCVADYVWVEGDLCEVAMELHNPLPFELKVLNMVRTFSVTNVMLHSGDMVWVHVVWWLTCLYCGAFLPTVLFWSCTIWFFSLVMDEEDFTGISFKGCVTGSNMICPDIFWITIYVGKNVYLLKDGV